MGTVRYLVALALLVTLPPGILFWFLVHPFAGFWRRRGPARTYTLMAVPCLGLLAGLVAARGALLRVEYGTRPPQMALAAVFLGLGFVVALGRRKKLTLRILTGLQELSGEGNGGELLTDGIYARVRHPRYLEVLLALVGYALFANYLALYVLVALCLPLGWVLIALEERELHARFGARYADYCRAVPRLIPRLRSRT